jgi:RNA polymerase sigma-70 factor (ECF subfamily)
VLRSRSRRNGREDALEAASELADPGPGPREEACHAESASEVRRALRDLPRDQRQAIEAAYFNGMSHTEVASALGQPLGTIKTRIRTGLAALRRALASPQEGLA